MQISLGYVQLNLLCDVLFRFYTICLPHQLFWPANISFQYYFISCILQSPLLTFTIQVAATTDITEIKCATLKNYYHAFSHNLRVRLLTVRLISCSKHVTPLRNCRCIVVSSFLGVHLTLGCSRNKATVWKRQSSCTQGPTSSSHCKVYGVIMRHEWKCASQIPSSGRNHEPTFLCRCTTPTAKCKNDLRTGASEMGCSTMTMLPFILLCLCKFSSQ